MEYKHKKVLVVGIATVALVSLVLSLALGIERMVGVYDNPKNDDVQISNVQDEQKQAEQRAVEDKIAQLSDAKEWQLFTSRKCGFSFLHPSEASINSGWLLVDPLDACELGVYIRDGIVSTEYFRFHIRPLPYPSVNEEFNPNKLTENTVKGWDAKKVTEELLDLNKTVFVEKYNRQNALIPIKEIRVNGKKAYMFSLQSGYFNWAGDSHHLDKETNFVYISDNKGKVYEITFPSSDRLSVLILESLKFSN